MNHTNIRQILVRQDGKKENLCLMDQEIKESRVNYHWLEANREASFEPVSGSIRVFLLIRGDAVFENESSRFGISGKGVFIGKADTQVRILCTKKAEILELVRFLTPTEWQTVTHSNQLPFSQLYEKAPLYREEGKSEKTINRMLVPQRIIPRFAMGSVETQGKDYVAKHKHPMVEQYFFSFKENDCSILIDEQQYPYKGNTLLHIPLGSDHGIASEEGQRIHYVWMDFLFGEEGLKYMDEVHHMI